MLAWIVFAMAEGATRSVVQVGCGVSDEVECDLLSR